MGYDTTYTTYCPLPETTITLVPPDETTITLDPPEIPSVSLPDPSSDPEVPSSDTKIPSTHLTDEHPTDSTDLTGIPTGITLTPYPSDDTTTWDTFETPSSESGIFTILPISESDAVEARDVNQ